MSVYRAGSVVGWVYMDRKHWVIAVVAVTAAALGASFLWAPQAPEPLGPAPTPLGWQAQIDLLGGDGIAGNSAGKGDQTRFSDPWGVTMGGGLLFVADAGENNRILYRSLDGVFQPLAGGVEGFADGQGTAARFNTPSGIALDAQGNLYVADTGNHAIRRITTQGQVTTVAGDGTPGFADGNGPQARFNGPMGVAVGADGRIYVADTWNDRIRVIAADGTVSTLAGGALPGWEDGQGAQARFDTPTDLKFDSHGNLWVADLQNNALRTVSSTGMVSTRVGMPNADRVLWGPMSLAITHDDVVYVGERLSGRVVQLSPHGHLVAVAGNDAQRFARPAGLALAPDGSLLLSDADAYRIHHLVPRTATAADLPPQLGPSPDNPLPGNQGRWPLAPQLGWHEVTGTLGEVRGNFSGESRHHLHSGFDVRGDVGQTVLAVASAKVSSPASTWTLGGQAEGLSLDKLDYIHMKVGRDAANRPLDPTRMQLVYDEAGQLDRVRVRRGTRFQPGDALGSINNQAHVHLAIGPSGYERNAVRLGFSNYADHVAPKIDDIALLDGNDQRLTEKLDGRLQVPRNGAGLQLVVEAWDQVDNNLPRRRLGLYSLGYQILDASGRALPGYEQPRTNIIFNRMPPQREAVKLAYAADSGITVHGSSSTRFRYVLTNTVRDGLLGKGELQLLELQPGNYTIRINAKDFSGNQALVGNTLEISVTQ